MPKAAVNEDGETLIYECHVWLTRKGLSILFPPSQAHASEHSPKPFLKLCAFGFDGLHCPSSVFGSKVVGHS